jgi:hypothetical protein
MKLFYSLLAVLTVAATLPEGPRAVETKAPKRKWTELVVQGSDAEKVRRIAARFTDSPTEEFLLYQTPDWVPLTQVKTWPRGLSPVGQLDLITLVPEERCADAWVEHMFHSYTEPNRFEHWKDAGCCAAWREE